MKLRNAAVDPEFTHVRHFRYAGFYNGEGVFVPTRMTILSRVEDDKVIYKVGFCSKNETSFNKKLGVQKAQESDHVFETRIPEKSFHEIDQAIIEDLVKNRQDHMPFAHRRFSQMIVEDLFLQGEAK